MLDEVSVLLHVLLHVLDLLELLHGAFSLLTKHLVLLDLTLIFFDLLVLDLDLFFQLLKLSFLLCLEPLLDLFSLLVVSLAEFIHGAFVVRPELVHLLALLYYFVPQLVFSRLILGEGRDLGADLVEVSSAELQKLFEGVLDVVLRGLALFSPSTIE